MGSVRSAATMGGVGLVVACAVAAPALAATSRVEVRGVDDRALRAEIQAVITQSNTAPASRLEARRRATDAGERAIALLRSEGYYDYDVEADIGDGDTPVAFITVTPGPRSKIVDPKIEWVGAVPAAADAQAAIEAMALKLGEPGRAETVIAAEGRIVAVMERQGYADAEAKPRTVIVDHADKTVQPIFKIAAGAPVLMDGIEVSGGSRTRLAWLRKLVPWKSGQRYQPKAVAELERRLVETGAYDTVSVTLAPAARTKDGQRPVIVSLVDRPKGTLELGASYSTTEGAGVDSRWIVYNRLKRADTLTTSLQIAQLDSRLQTELAIPHFGKAAQTLKLTAALYRDDTTAYTSSGGVLSADLTHKFSKISYLTYGVSLDDSITDEKEAANFVASGRRRNLLTFSVLGAFNLDKSNDPLDPTSGWRLGARAEPTYAMGDGSIAYLKTSAQLSAYLPLDGALGTVLAGRAKLGAIVGGDIPRVPAPARFYAGGGGSVRGYAYQAVGPRYPDNTPEGGLSLVEASLEVRQPITKKWSAVAFIDAGAAGKQVTPDFSHPDIGIGVGVRYNLGFGPIRVDIGTPLHQRHGDAPIQLYFSIGQSF
ncbi:MAG: autotransporter assembly complex protein TamA [Caulobacteraceae bacterium]|nr:autotransporter assembly complex protein TamA [Caulobacteraceae bacterium]